MKLTIEKLLHISEFNRLVKKHPRISSIEDFDPDNMIPLIELYECGNGDLVFSATIGDKYAHELIDLMKFDNVIYHNSRESGETSFRVHEFIIVGGFA